MESQKLALSYNELKNQTQELSFKNLIKLNQTVNRDWTKTMLKPL